MNKNDMAGEADNQDAVEDDCFSTALHVTVRARYAGGGRARLRIRQ